VHTVNTAVLLANQPNGHLKSISHFVSGSKTHKLKHKENKRHNTNQERVVDQSI